MSEKPGCSRAFIFIGLGFIAGALSAALLIKRKGGKDGTAVPDTPAEEEKAYTREEYASTYKGEPDISRDIVETACDVGMGIIDTANSKQIDYTSFSLKAGSREADKPVNTPYVISPDEFGESDDYDTLSLIYYSDGVLVDEENMILNDPESYVGSDALDSFGEYLDDAVYVRDDDKMREFEILLDEREYSDTIPGLRGR